MCRESLNTAAAASLDDLLVGADSPNSVTSSPRNSGRSDGVLRQTAVASVIAVVSLTMACTGMRSSAPTTTEQQTRLEVRVGDTVRILTKYRERHSFKVTDLTATSLVGTAVTLSRDDSDKSGTPIEVPYADLALVEVKHVSAVKTAGAAVLVLFVAGMAVLAVEGLPVGLLPP